MVLITIVHGVYKVLERFESSKTMVSNIISPGLGMNIWTQLAIRKIPCNVRFFVPMTFAGKHVSVNWQVWKTMFGLVSFVLRWHVRFSFLWFLLSKSRMLRRCWWMVSLTKWVKVLSLLGSILILNGYIECLVTCLCVCLYAGMQEGALLSFSVVYA